ncbi:MAG TPA: prepilin peptidase [Candidatus Acidoferrales bacterium]|nr:prepilin peptidase [Candidatus Acidoferrales bacterium]
MVNLGFNLFLLLFVAFATAFDVFQRRIPNWLVLAGALGGLLFSLAEGPPSGFESFLGLLVGIGILVVPFALGWLGAGDVKLLGAVGALLGVRMLPRVFFYTALCGMLMALVSIAFRGTKWQAFSESWREFKLALLTRGQMMPSSVGEKVSAGNRAVPYGVAIATGAVVAFFIDSEGKWAGF